MTVALEEQQEWCKYPRKLRKTTEVVRPCEENETGAHSEKNAICGHSRENKKRADKPKTERHMQERYDRGGSERGRDNKQGSIGEYDHQP